MAIHRRVVGKSCLVAGKSPHTPGAAAQHPHDTHGWFVPST